MEFLSILDLSRHVTGVVERMIGKELPGDSQSGDAASMIAPVDFNSDRCPVTAPQP